MTTDVWSAIGSALDLAQPQQCMVQAEPNSYLGTVAEPVGAGASVLGLTDRIDTAVLLAMEAAEVNIVIAIGAILVAIVMTKSQRGQCILLAHPRVRRLADEPVERRSE